MTFIPARLSEIAELHSRWLAILVCLTLQNNDEKTIFISQEQINAAKQIEGVFNVAKSDEGLTAKFTLGIPPNTRSGVVYLEVPDA